MHLVSIGKEISIHKYNYTTPICHLFFARNVLLPFVQVRGGVRRSSGQIKNKLNRIGIEVKTRKRQDSTPPPLNPSRGE